MHGSTGVDQGEMGREKGEGEDSGEFGGMGWGDGGWVDMGAGKYIS